MYHFLAFLFFLHKEKEPLRQQASPEPEIKNLNITYLPALLPTGLCKTQLNLSPLNSTLQYIKRKFFKRDDKARTGDSDLPARAKMF